MFKNRFTQVQFLLIALVWLLLFTIPILFGESNNGFNWNHIFKIWREYGLLLLIFIANRFVLMPTLFLKGKRVWYFLSIGATIFSFSFILYLLHTSGAPSDSHNFPGPGHFPPGDLGGPGEIGKPGHIGRPGSIIKPGEFIPPYANLTILSILLIGFDSGLLFFSKWMQSEQTKLKIEKESIGHKMAFLQNQISPHFFMNTLNNIHALIDFDGEQAKDSVIKLSHMMDYMLTESQSKTIALDRELQFINSYVDLMKLRVIENVELKFEVPDEIPNINIPPLLTISFIENAFKYGISYQGNSFIHIRYLVSDNQLCFTVKNSNFAQQSNRKQTGIGIENTKKRLELIYDKNYDLSIIDNVDLFDVTLKLPL